MRHFYILLCLLAAALPLRGGPAPEAWNDISVTGTFEYASEYVFRGYRQTSGAFQGAVEIGYPFYQGNVYIGMWTNQPLADAGQSNEMTGHVGYAIPLFKQLHIDFGQIYYWYPEGNANGSADAGGIGFLRGLNRSNESYIGLWGATAELFEGIHINPSLYYYYDWNTDKHTIELTLYHVWDLAELTGIEGLSTTPKIYAGYQTASRPYGDTGATQNVFFRADGFYYGANLTVTYQLNKWVQIFVEGFFAGNQDTSANPQRDHDQFIGASVGVKLGL